MYAHLPPLQKARIFEMYGFSELPEPEEDIQSDDGPLWHWFCLNILPLNDDLKYRFLVKTSLAVRLEQMIKVLIRFMLTPFMQARLNNQNNDNSNNGTGVHSSSSSNTGSAESDHSPENMNFDLTSLASSSNVPNQNPNNNNNHNNNNQNNVLQMVNTFWHNNGESSG